MRAFHSWFRFYCFGCLAVMLATIAFFFAVRPWTWGIVDEPGMVMSARQMKTLSLQENVQLLTDSLHPARGSFKPLWLPYLYARLILVDSARAQHAIQLGMLLAVLWIWWRFAAAFGVDSGTRVLGVICTLYFGPLTFASLSMFSLQELPGLLLISIGLYLAQEAAYQPKKRFLFAIVFSSAGACLMKETFFIFIPLIGFLLLSGDKNRAKALTAAVLGVLFLSLAIFLWVFVKGDYSAKYSLDVIHIGGNVFRYFKNLAWTYKFAAPFLALGLISKLLRRDFDKFDGVCAAGALAYFGILVPWTAEIGYYQGPGGPFLGFLTGRAISSLLAMPHTLTRRLAAGAVCASLLLMCSSVYRQSAKTYLFNRGLSQGQDYLIGHLAGEIVYTNGEEAAATIPAGMHLKNGQIYKGFVYAHPGDELKTPSYVIEYESERYPHLTLPGHAKEVFQVGPWTIFQLTGAS